MKGLIWLLVLASLAVAAAVGASLNDGYVLVVFPPWRLEISLNLFLLAMGLALLLGYGLVRSLVVSFGLPARVRSYRARRQREQGSLIFQDAVRLLFEGRFGQALKKSDAANEAGIAPGLSALIAARAAQRLRDPLKQQGWLARAKIDDPRTEAATLMLEAEMANEERRYADALVALDHLQSRHGRHLAALRLELRARQGVKDWDGALRCARQLEKRGALPEELLREIRRQAHLGNVQERQGDAGTLVAYWRHLPEEERDGRLGAAVARALVVLQEDEAAGRLIEQLVESPAVDWAAGEAEALIRLYGRLAGGGSGRIGKAEQWLQRHPRDAALLLALGRLCRAQRLWGKAQSYLEAALSVAPSQEGHLELARLFDELERPEEANRHYRLSAGLEPV